MRLLVVLVGLFFVTPPGLAAQAQYLVTSPERGVLRVSRDGTALEVLSSTPAARGRLRGEGHVVFLAAGRNELRELELATGSERVVATLPGDLGLGCGGMFGSRQHENPGEPYVVADHLHPHRRVRARY